MGQGIEEIIDSVRQISNRWINTQVPLTADTSTGDTTLTLASTQRFQEGDEVMLRDATRGEHSHFVDEVIDDTHLSLVEPVRFSWTVISTSILQKAFDTQMLAGIYIGEPDNIPAFPAIVVKGASRASEWMTIDSTKEIYDLEVTIYNKSAAQDKGYRSLLKLTDSLIFGLKRNLYPLVAPYETVAVTADIVAGSGYIKVADSSIFTYLPARIIIEDQWHQSEIWVQSIIDATTIFVQPSPLCTFLLADTPQVILMKRFIFNSWPATTSYGEIFKGTLLKAAKISWFAWEELIESGPPRETYLH